MSDFHVEKQGKFCVEVHFNFLPMQSNRICRAVGSSGVLLLIYDNEGEDIEDDGDGEEERKGI